MKNATKILSLVLCLVLLFGSVFQIAGRAEQAEPEPLSSEEPSSEEPSSEEPSSGEPSSEEPSSEEPSSEEPSSEEPTTEEPVVIDDDDASVYTMYGDVDGDKTITASDARLVMLVAVKVQPIREKTVRFYAADVDYDGVLSSSDARLVLRAAVKLDSLGKGLPHEHQWGQWKNVTNSTCINHGQKAATCTLDASHVKYETLPLAAHKMKIVTKSVQEGDYLYKAPFYQCTVCSKRFSDAKGNKVLQPEKVYKITPITGTLKSKCDSISKNYNATAVQLAVIKDGHVVNTYCYGIADTSTGRRVNEDTKYRVASLSKIAVTCVFMALCDQGLVSEYDDISKYFGYKCYNPYYPNITITPSMILTHSASFIGDAGRTLQPGALCNKAYYYQTKPGTCEQYSNFGFSVIACICERVTGTPLNDLAKKYLFDPLGIDASYLAYKLKDTSNLGGLYGPEGTLTPAGMLSVRERPLGVGLTLAQGNLTISAKDYARILAMILNDGVAENGKRVLSKRSVDAMKKVRIICAHYGLGYAMRRETTVIPNKVVYAQSGSAYGMFGGYTVCPEDKAGVVVFTSGCARSRIASTQLYTICHHLIKTTYPY